jgi:hypothetical protein
MQTIERRLFLLENTPANGNTRRANIVDPASGEGRGANGCGRLSNAASGVWIVNVKLVTVPPGGKTDGLSEAVAPSGVPCTASVIGLDIAAPCIATEKLKVAALPAGTD